MQSVKSVDGQGTAPRASASESESNSEFMKSWS
jgi:hypothetical protein